MTMSSTSVHQAIEEIAAAKGKEKEAVLRLYIDDPMMLRCLCAALDPFITYGVKKLPTPDQSGMREFNEGTFDLLNDLATRKLTGGNAQEAIKGELERLTPYNQELLRRIILKDFRAGFTAGTVNRVKPGTIFVFECMLAHKFEEKHIKKWPQLVQPKYDGVRALAIYDADEAEVKLYSRTGKPFENFQAIAAELLQLAVDADLPSTVFDGELMADEFREIAGDIHKKGVQAEGTRYHVFDTMPIKAFNNPEGHADNMPYAWRHKRLRTLLSGSYHHLVVPPLWKVESVEQIMMFHGEQLAAGGEGVIVKDPTARYEKKRSRAWLKVKDQNDCDVQVIGFEEGEGKYEGSLGALIVDFEGVEVRVGSGLTDQVRDAVWADQAFYLGVMCEVQYHERTPDGSMRHGRFKGWRFDKPAKDGVGV